mgnify:CR=1 FL=1|jgi:hypothetical protein
MFNNPQEADRREELALQAQHDVPKTCETGVTYCKLNVTIASLESACLGTRRYRAHVHHLGAPKGQWGALWAEPGEVEVPDRLWEPHLGGYEQCQSQGWYVSKAGM